MLDSRLKHAGMTGTKSENESRSTDILNQVQDDRRGCCDGQQDCPSYEALDKLETGKFGMTGARQ